MIENKSNNFEDMSNKQNEKNSLVLGWEFAYQNDRPCIVITEQIGNEIYILGSSFESAGKIELKGYRKASEVAEEIFGEIEFDIAQLDFDREETRAIAIEGIIANAKKKYTEGGE